mmetsp:Transcript_34256/g.53444  ORF Transcript_34256/g.53444 Transcript_34256/m.53444 type:complete len:328 (+) Transcript_34256:393-1376(+)
MLRLSADGLDDDSLHSLFSSTAPRSIILIEDIDATTPVVRRDEFQGAPQDKQFHSSHAVPPLPGVTLAGLLNAIDGIAAQESRVLFMTCNFVEKLNPALIRPGRIDYTLGFGHASRDQLYTLFLRFYEDHGKTSAHATSLEDVKKSDRDEESESHNSKGIGIVEDLAQTFSRKVSEAHSQVTMAGAMGLLLRYRHRPYDALAAIPNWIQNLSTPFRLTDADKSLPGAKVYLLSDPHPEVENGERIRVTNNGDVAKSNTDTHPLPNQIVPKENDDYATNGTASISPGSQSITRSIVEKIDSVATLGESIRRRKQPDPNGRASSKTCLL